MAEKYLSTRWQRLKLLKQNFSKEGKKVKVKLVKVTPRAKALKTIKSHIAAKAKEDK